VHYVRIVQVKDTIEELEEKGFYDWNWDGITEDRGMVMDDLEEVVFCIFKDHVNGLVFQHDLAELNDIDILNLAIECDLATATLADSSVSNDLTLLVWFKFLDCIDCTVAVL